MQQGVFIRIYSSSSKSEQEINIFNTNIKTKETELIL